MDMDNDVHILRWLSKPWPSQLSWLSQLMLLSCDTCVAEMQQRLTPLAMRL